MKIIYAFLLNSQFGPIIFIFGFCIFLALLQHLLGLDPPATRIKDDNDY